MPLANRVDPYGAIHAVPERGLLFGNRGCLHDDDGRVVRTHQGRRWITCRLAFKGRRRPLVVPGRYTELFFLDEATAFAAGHRPCAECRRDDYRTFGALTGLTSAGEIDAELHAQRLGRRRAARSVASLPDGAVVDIDGCPALVVDGALLPWSFSGYGRPIARAPARAPVLTPPLALTALARGYAALLHPSARL